MHNQGPIQTKQIHLEPFAPWLTCGGEKKRILEDDMTQHWPQYLGSDNGSVLSF